MIHVSIHAPARGATLIVTLSLVFLDVSIHAPARGATGNLFRAMIPNTAFQSTRPHGARPPWPFRDERQAPVSIHAPARGATRSSPWRSNRGTCFNPRARTGRDCIAKNTLNHKNPPENLGSFAYLKFVKERFILMKQRRCLSLMYASVSNHTIIGSSGSAKPVFP
jgi:hypothetical protein